MNEFSVIKLSPVGKPIYSSDEVELRLMGILIIVLNKFIFILMSYFKTRKRTSSITKGIENY